MRRLLQHAVLALVACCPEAKRQRAPAGFCGTFRPLPPTVAKQLPEVSQLVVQSVCDYLDPQPPPRLSLDRWTDDAAAKLLPAVEAVEAGLESSKLAGTPILGPGAGGRLADGQEPPWPVLKEWLEQVALESEAFEIRALSAPILEEMWHFMTKVHGIFGTAGLIPRDDAAPGQYDADDNAQMMATHFGPIVLLAYKQAGRMEQAQRCLTRMLAVQDGVGSYPLRYFYDTGDVRRVSGFPLPGLRPLAWPEPEQVLPEGVAEALLSAYPQIKTQAEDMLDSGMIDGAGDAYPVRRATLFFECFPYVCPEPVWVN